MKRFLSRSLIFAASLISTCVFASSQTATIESIQIANDGRTMVTLTGNRADKPACATYNYWFIADENSNAGKAQLSALLAAHMAGRSVTVAGSGSCVRWVDGENISSITVIK